MHAHFHALCFFAKAKHLDLALAYKKTTSRKMLVLATSVSKAIGLAAIGKGHGTKRYKAILQLQCLKHGSHFHKICRQICIYSQLHKRTVCFGLVGSYGAKIATTRGLENGVLQGRCVEGLKWHTYYHSRPSMATIVDLFVLPELCFQSLSTFYCRFHCRPLNHFGFHVGLSVSRQTRWPLRVQNTNKDEMNCSIKVWPLV